jgi:pilus assembly protein CpaE
MVTQLDLPCLRNVVRLMMSFEEEEGLKERTKILVNRVGLGSGEISLKKAQETIDREIFWQLPNDYRTMVEVRNNGVPLIEQAPKAAITLSLREMGNALTGGESTAAAGDKSTSSWFKFFSKTGKGKEPAQKES